MRSVRWAGSIKETEEPWQEGQEVTAAVTSESHQLGLAVWRLEVILADSFVGLEIGQIKGLQLTRKECWGRIKMASPSEL